MKTNFLKTIEANLIGLISVENIQQVAGVVTLALENYELIDKCTAVIPYEGAADEMMYKKFMACKLMSGFSPRSAKHYNYTIGKFSQYVNHKPLQKITTDDITSYLSKKGFIDKVSAVTCVNIKRVLNSFFTYLNEEDYIDKNPIRRVAKIKIPKRIKRPLSDEELEILRSSAITLRDKAMIDFMYSTAIRCSEMCSLNISDVNFSTLTARVIGKGNKERFIYISERAKVSLVKYIESRKDSNPALFCGLRAAVNKRLNVAGVEIRLRQLGQKLGIPNVHPHRLRRTMATVALRTAPINVVCELLGHESITTTTIYASTSMEQARAAHRLAIN
ncbi:MAG: tyrosine-type recombinase/integrase [Bacteroidales bacterium]